MFAESVWIVIKKIAEAFHSAKDHALLNEVPLRTKKLESPDNQHCEHSVK